MTVTGGNFVRQVGAPTPVANLPAAVQAALTTAQNASTQNSNELLVITVSILSYQETLNILSAGGAGAGEGEGGRVEGRDDGRTGGCNNCGQDKQDQDDKDKEKKPKCASPPCGKKPTAARTR